MSRKIARVVGSREGEVNLLFPYPSILHCFPLIFRLSPLSERLEQPVTMATVTGERHLRNDRVVVTTDLHAHSAF